MSATQPQTAVAQTPTVAMLRTLGLVAAISGLLVVSSFLITKPMIERNQAEAIERALFKVVPGAVSRADFIFDGEELVPLQPGIQGDRVYAGYDADGQLKGVALEAAAAGYSGVIRILYGYDPYCMCVRGIQVLKMSETPGIGDKIITDAVFQANFDALEARPNAAGDGLQNAIVTVKRGEKDQPWQIDSISGATISSKAVARMLDQRSQRMVPVIVNNLDRLENPS